MQPTAYVSRTLQPHEKNYRVTELEALGAVWAVKHFRPYLYRHSCHLHTDYEALKSLLNTLREVGKMGTGTAGGGLAHPLSFRQENANADAFSCCPLALKNNQASQRQRDQNLESNEPLLCLDAEADPCIVTKMQIMQNLSVVASYGVLPFQLPTEEALVSLLLKF